MMADEKGGGFGSLACVLRVSPPGLVLTSIKDLQEYLNEVQPLAQPAAA